MKYKSTSSDPELRIQLEQCEPYFQAEDFKKFLQAQKRFDGPVTMMETNETITHYHLRGVLREIPPYMQTAKQIGLDYEQGIELLLHLFDGDKYTFSDKESDLIILTKALDASKGDKGLARNIGKIKRLMSAGVGGSGMGGGIYSFFITSRLGIPVAEASPMIVDGAEGSYVIGPFNEALKSMLPTRPNPELVIEAFHILNNDGGNYWNAGDYRYFEQLMTFGAPASGIGVDDMLAMFVSASKSKRERKKLEGAIGKKDVQESKEKYFLQFEGQLNHFAQPYVTRRSLNDGIRDLEKLANGSSRDWVEIGEGMFVFDPESQSWYSLGGKLETPSMGEVLSGRAERVRHNFLSYDISSLSQIPFLFHVHPRELDCFIAPRREELVYPELREHITKFLTATPSRADYRIVAQLMKEAKEKIKPRSFIAHSLGITEFVYPYDIKVIEEMGEKSRDIRDQTLLNPQHPLLHLTEASFVEGLIQDLNSRLPSEFAVNLNP